MQRYGSTSRDRDKTNFYDAEGLVSSLLGVESFGRLWFQSQKKYCRCCATVAGRGKIQGRGSQSTAEPVHMFVLFRLITTRTSNVSRRSGIVSPAYRKERWTSQTTTYPTPLCLNMDFSSWIASTIGPNQMKTMIMMTMVWEECTEREQTSKRKSTKVNQADGALDHIICLNNFHEPNNP